jgi:hypothetical protein
VCRGADCCVKLVVLSVKSCRLLCEEDLFLYKVVSILYETRINYWSSLVRLGLASCRVRKGLCDRRMWVVDTL